MTLVIENVMLRGKTTDVAIEGNRIASVGKRVRGADEVVDGKGKALLPGFVNAHTHAAMTLLRGYADDLPLQEWLSKRVWPVEAKLTPDDIYWGTKLACLEMVRTGTTTFNDMYFHMEAAGKAAKEMGLRAVLSEGLIDLGNPAKGEEEMKRIREVNHRILDLRTERIRPALGPHAIYTLSKETWGLVRQHAEEKGYLVHTHLSETRQENEECIRKHGHTPTKVLESLGLLGPHLVAAHCVWLDAHDVALLGRHKVKAVHNPTSNMKLAVGRAMPYAQLRKAGVTVALGTDGTASNNSLDMAEAMKAAALLHKFYSNDPTLVSAADAFHMATAAGADALGIEAGRVEPGKLADLVLVDLKRPEMTPLHDLTANVVYASRGGMVDTVLCDGQVLMRNGHVEGEEKILAGAAKAAKDLMER